MGWQWLAGFTLASVGAFAATSTSASQSRDFEASCQAIWPIALEVFDSKGFDPLSVDRSSGFARFTWREGALLAFGGAGKATRAFTHSGSGFASRIVNFQVQHATLLLKERPVGCSVSVRAVFQGYRDTLLGPAGWRVLPTNGAMESEILAEVARRGPSSEELGLTATSREPAESNRRLAPAPQGYGSLRIEADVPGAEVTINGGFVGSAPLSKRLVPGAVVIEAKTADGRSWRREMEVADGDELTVHVDFGKSAPAGRAEPVSEAVRETEPEKPVGAKGGITIHGLK